MSYFLTESQKKLCTWIQNYIEDNSHSPSIREMQEAMELRSPAPVQYHLKQLRDKGYVDWQDGQPRTVKVLLDVNSRREKKVVLCDACGGKLRCERECNSTSRRK